MIPHYSIFGGQMKHEARETVLLHDTEYLNDNLSIGVCALIRAQ